MIYTITSECVNCGECLEVCPVSAIVDGDEHYIITDACVDCGRCQKVCPVDAIRGNGQ